LNAEHSNPDPFASSARFGYIYSGLTEDLYIMRTTADLIPSAEAAFIAGLTDKEIHRVVDDGVLPEALYERDDGRRFARIAGAFARFYFETSDQLTKSMRREVIETLTKRLLQRPDHDAMFALSLPVSAMDWRVNVPFVSVVLEDVVALTQQRAGRVARANRSIVEDPDVMGGVPVFTGTRVPIEAVVGSRATGVSERRLLAAYPFLTPEVIEDAEIYLQVHPRRGRPRKLGGMDGANPDWKVVTRKTVRQGSRRA
jgi:uncharacterized protein (DUF433 family)